MNFTFFGDDPFAVYFIQDYTKVIPPQTLGHICPNAFTIILLFKKIEKLSLKEVMLSMCLSGPVLG